LPNSLVDSSLRRPNEAVILDTDLYLVTSRCKDAPWIQHHGPPTAAILQIHRNGAGAYNWPVKNNTVVVIRTTTSSQYVMLGTEVVRARMS